MKKLGISIYPAHSNIEKDKEYLILASKYGYQRLFMCMLSEVDDKDTIIAKYKDICDFAHKYGYEISVDTNFDVFNKLKATARDLRVFKEIGIDIIRLDGPFTDSEYIAMTKNPYGIKIEFNGSIYQNLNYLVKLGAKRDNMVVCANFYPLKYTGLSFEKYVDFTKTYKPDGYRNAAFVSSNALNTFGPWPVYDGLVTIEECRYKDIVDQARMLLTTDSVDDIIIGNAYATEEEIKKLSKLNLNHQTYYYQGYDISDLEQKLLNSEIHYRRLDCGDYLIRAISGRGKGYDIKPNNAKTKIEVGDLLIINNNSPHYKGEVHIALKEMENDGSRNVVGKLNDYELSLIKHLKDNHIFILVRKED